MAVTIGHASLDENGKISGGSAGDQSGKEVRTQSWYNKGWNVVLRPKSAALAEKSALACEAGCANSMIGYDQGQRNTLNTQAKAVGYDLSAIATGCECDCSSFMHVCAIAGGANLSYGSNGHTTRTMVAAYAASGDYEKLTASKYLTSDKYLKRGDILVKEGSHTAMALTDGTSAETTEVVATIKTTVTLPVLTKGCKGSSVKALQILLIGNNCSCGSYGADGDFGSLTHNAVTKYQKNNALEVDGSVGPATWAKLLGV